LALADAGRIRHVVDRWLPLLIAHGTPDARWRWPEKASDVCYKTGVEHVMITHAEQVEGVMVTSLPDRRPPLSSLPDLLYVEYVAAAPWNRPLRGESQVFKAIGPRLLSYAVRRSMREGREGRLGLHSEPDPNTLRFYRDKVRLRPCGADGDQEDRAYFEGDA